MIYKGRIGFPDAPCRHLQPLLAQVGRVVLTDLRGLGEESNDKFDSHAPDDTGGCHFCERGSMLRFRPYQSPRPAGRDILALLEAENITDAVLVGCSFAGASVVYAAAKAPARVRGVVLISPFAWDHPMPFGVPTLLRTLLNRCTGPGFWTSYYKGCVATASESVGAPAGETTLPRVPRCRLHKRAAAVPDLDSHVARVRALLGSGPARIATVWAQINASKAVCAAELPALAMAHLPALAVYGSADPDFKVVGAEANEMVARLGGTDSASSVIVAECGHYPHVEDPAAVADAVLAFVRRLQ